MSSWIIKRLPQRKSKEPTVVPTSEHHLIVQSESFQPNRVVNSISTINDAPVTAVNPRQFVPKKIDTVVSPTAVELVHDDKTYIFVILRHIRTVRDNDLWISSYNSIRKYYTNKIIIIDDNSSINTVNGKLINTEIIKSEFNGAGEILPYYYFLKYKWADKMIFLHDSMFLNRRFRDSELDGQIRFHWYFNSDSELYDFNKISKLLLFINNSKRLETYVSNNEKWYGCFGASSISSLDTLQYIEKEYNIFKNLVLTIKSRKDRESFERIFGIIFYYEGIFTDDNCSNFGNIMKYPNAFESNTNFEEAAHILQNKGYDTAIIKVWRGR